MLDALGPGGEAQLRVRVAGALAAELDVALVASLFEKRAAGLYHNTAAILDGKRGYLGKYRKMHIPDDPGFYEKFYFTPGDLGFEQRLAEVERETSPWVMAGQFAVQHVLRPAETRDWLIRMLQVHQARASGGVGRHLLQSWPCYL